MVVTVEFDQQVFLQMRILVVMLAFVMIFHCPMVKALKRYVQHGNSWGGLGRVSANLTPSMVGLHTSLKCPRLFKGKHRDIFPLGLVTTIELTRRSSIKEGDLGDALDYVNGVVLALNALYGIRPPARCIAQRNSSQMACLTTIIAAVNALHQRIRHAARSEVDSQWGWSLFERGGTSIPLALVADAVDIPEVAATCDPCSILSVDVSRFISDPSCVFPCTPPNLHRFTGFYADPRYEYIRLVVRQLRAGLLKLSSHCLGGGTIFPVGTSDGRQRAVWHGT